MMVIKYLFHSGFLINTDKYTLVFDYFEDNCKKKNNSECGRLTPEDFSDDKTVVFFVSHAHYDHFGKEIFSLHKNSKYVISNDLKIAKNENIVMCGPYQEFEVEGIKIKTFGSTDEGLSYLIQIDGKSIFHAGDLNWWHWDGETETEKESAKQSFFREIDILKKNDVDIAFFPVDPRLEDAYYFGGKHFIEEIGPKIFIPMHFQDCHYITKKFKTLMDSQNKNTKIIEIEKRGQELAIEI
ncbi:MBL fold metallo-hydrolase [Proteocatella sphenisci]|uniref:MBL fold metallo-hydrolase n=1 Tax=Proteocatella sphenisci TaxID=181070 RepID=UPI00048D8FF1|nr:MBL fold metallo-hydrolase [Proteocatella sphenisci]